MAHKMSQLDRQLNQNLTDLTTPVSRKEFKEAQRKTEADNREIKRYARRMAVAAMLMGKIGQ